MRMRRMTKPPSPFGANPKRYRNVPKRVKQPKTESGCIRDIAVVTAFMVAMVMALCVI